MSEMRSVHELMEKVVCPRPCRHRADDNIVELFLHSYRSGRFASRQNWLTQSQQNVEAIASDSAGITLAVEHTRIFAFGDHKRQEELLRPIARSLEAEPRLSVPRLRFHLCFYPSFLEGLSRRQRSRVQQGLLSWAVQILPALPVRGRSYKFDVPIRLTEETVRKIKLDVEVSERVEPMHPVSVGGWLPSDAQRLCPQVRKMLKDKLPKLAAAEADRRFLIIELPTTDSKWFVVDTVRAIAGDFPLLKQVNWLVVAQTLAFQSEGVVFFHVWDIAAQVWSDHMEAIVATEDRLAGDSAQHRRA